MHAEASEWLADSDNNDGSDNDDNGGDDIDNGDDIDSGIIFIFVENFVHFLSEKYEFRFFISRLRILVPIPGMDRI